MILDIKLHALSNTTAIEFLNIAEVLILLIAMFCLCICLRVFFISPQFHVHLIALLVHTAFLAYTIHVNRILMIILSIITPYTDPKTEPILYSIKRLAEFLHFSSCVCIMGNLPVLIGERLIATIWLSNYENHRNFLCIFIVIILQYGISFCMTWAMYVKIVPILPAIGFGLFLTVVSVALFKILHRINQHRYKKSKFIGTTYTLSERYQLAENIRTAGIMKKCCFLGSAFNCFGALILAAFYSFRDHEITPHVLYVLFNLFVIVYTILFLLMGMFSHQIWKENFVAIIKRIVRCKNLGRNASGTAELKNTDGSRMSFSIDEQRQYYFNSLSTSWN